MTIAAEPMIETQGVRPHRFTAEEYWEMARLGFFDGKSRVPASICR